MARAWNPHIAAIHATSAKLIEQKNVFLGLRRRTMNSNERISKIAQAKTIEDLNAAIASYDNELMETHRDTPRL